MDEDVPIVATSKHVVVNTITAADDYLKMIQPSPSAIPVYETNTYYSTVEFTKTINDDEITKVIETQDVITQVIVTESLPHGRMPMSISHGHIDQSEEDLAYDDEPEVHNTIKKTNAINVSPTKIDQKPAGGNTAVPLHLYATKTYLTTFTYFTTLLQSAAGEISTTVDSHTRVIENVITESIASSMIPTDILSSISKNLFDNEKNDLKTRIVLNNGQKLEITAANILKPVDFATATKISSIDSNDLEAAGNDLSPASILLSSEEVENFISEPDEHIVEQPPPLKLPSSNVKPKPVSSYTGSGSLKIPSLLNSISMPNFSALGPVINAMAGLLSNNFGSIHVPTPYVHPLPIHKVRPYTADHENLPQPLPLFSQESQDLILSQTDSKNTPLYIPVNGGRPNAGDGNYHHASMMGSGISISPGEIITANSDVIVGRPAVIGPKLPPNINKPVEVIGMQAPPPFVPLKTPQRPSSFVKDIKSNGNINHVTIKKGDDYFGPVPPKEVHIPNQPQHQQSQQQHLNSQQQQSQPQHQKSKQQHQLSQHQQQPQSLQHKPIPLNTFSRHPPPQSLQKIQPIIPPMMRPNHPLNPNRHQNIVHHKPVPTQESQINSHFVKIDQNGNNNQNVHNGPIKFLQEQPKGNQNQHPFRNQPQQQQQQHKEHYHGQHQNSHNGNYQNPQPYQTPQNSHHQKHTHEHHVHQGPQHHQLRPQNNENSNKFFNNQNVHKPLSPQPNVIEIQKIPEVFSTDLPIITVNNQHLFQSQSGNQILTHHELPEIFDKPTKGQPLLVDIQPSQVANVVIPHGSSSIFVFGGVHKAHKAGQYFDDPSPHGDAEIGIKSVNLLADIEGSGAKTQGHHKLGPQVHYDVKDNIIVASENIQSSISPSFNIFANIQPTISRPPHDFIHHSVNVVPNSVIRFHPDTAEISNRPTTQQLINQQKQQQIQIDQQLKQKQIENQKRQEIENQKRAEFENQKRQEIENQKRIEFENKKRQEIENQKRLEFENQKRQELENQKRQEIENQKRIEFENKKRQEFIQHQKEVEQQKRIEQEEIAHLKQIEMDRKREYENQKQIEHEQRQKLIEHQKRQQEIENQKRIQDQKMKLQFEQQQKIQQELKLRQQFEQQQKLHHDMKMKQQQVQFNIRPPAVVPHFGPVRQEQHSSDSGFIILSSNYGPHSVNQVDPPVGSFIPLPPQPSANQHEDDMDNETDSDGQVVQESINRPKLPSGQNHESLDEEDVKVEEYDNFVYHKITGSTEDTTTTPQSTTHRSSFVPISTERFVPSTERYGPVYKAKPYPNLQFDNLPKSVNELQNSRPIKNTFHRIPPLGVQFKKTNFQTANTLSQSMQPPSPPRNSRRPTAPFKKTTFKISMPINPMPDDNSVSNLQTEEPFNPKYTEDYSTKPSMTTEATSVKTTDATTEKQTVTTSSPKIPTHVSTTEKSDLNIGEVEANKRNSSTDENLDIFDSKESINPLNHGFVKHKDEKDDIDLMPPSVRKPYHTINRIPEAVTFKSTGIRLDISSIELESMKPPPPGFKISTKAPAFDEIVNMKPPAPVVDVKPKPNYGSRPTISLSKYTPSTSTTKTTTASSESPETPSSYVTIYRSRVSPATYRPVNRTRYTTKKSEKESYDIVLHYKQGKNKETNRNNDDLIIGSVEAVDNDQSMKSSINATPVINTETSNKISTTPTIRSSVSISSSTRTHSKPLRSRIPGTVLNEDRKHQNRTKSFLDPIKVSTKYITNTKTITLAKTKTEVINRSHGVPITTTRVHTATVYETITETLLKPTVITSIHPTSTFILPVVRETLQPTSEEVIEGFVEDLDEFIINDDDIERVNSGEHSHEHSGQNDEHDSILVVMTDKKTGTILNIDHSIINNHTSHESDDVSRDEEDNKDAADHILLGGILIASPPQLNKSKQGAAISSQCLPECKSTKNEYCQRTLGQMRCVCRPGFARMFPDRPCKRK